MAFAPFDIKLLGADGLHRIVLAGELDLAASPRLLATVQDLLSTRPDELEIDLRGVRFIDSTGLRTLLVAIDESRAADIACYLIPSSNPSVQRVFEITALEVQLPWRAPITDSERATVEGLERAYAANDDPEPEPAA